MKAQAQDYFAHAEAAQRSRLKACTRMCQDNSAQTYVRTFKDNSAQLLNNEDVVEMEWNLSITPQIQHALQLRKGLIIIEEASYEI